MSNTPRTPACRVCGKPNDPDDVAVHEACDRAIEQANQPHFTVPGHRAEVEAARIRAERNQP